VIRVRFAVTTTSEGQIVDDPKSDAGRRDVAVPPHIIPEIERHLDRFTGRRRDALLFPAQHGGHLRPSAFYRHWYRSREAIERPDLRFHDLRHSGAVMAAVSGATLAELMDRLGHSTPAAAMRYQHASQSRAREVAALMSKLADT